jgi:hypothetical protein
VFGGGVCKPVLRRIVKVLTDGTNAAAVLKGLRPLGSVPLSDRSHMKTRMKKMHSVLIRKLRGFRGCCSGETAARQVLGPSEATGAGWRDTYREMTTCLRSARRIHHRNVVACEVGVAGDDRQTFDECLSDEQAIERVAVQRR